MKPPHHLFSGLLLATLGLSGTALAINPAAVPVHTRAELVAAHRTALKTKLSDHLTLTAFLDAPHNTPLFEALHALHVHTATMPVHELLVSGETKLTFSKVHRLLQVVNNGKPRPATATDLKALQISTAAQLHDLLRNQLRTLFTARGKLLPEHDADISKLANEEVRQAAVYVRDLPGRADASLLLDHDRLVTQRTHPGTARLELLDGTGDDSLTVDGVGKLSLLEGDKHTMVTFGDLTRLGLGTVAEFDALMARRLVKIAGIPGDAKDPSVVARARDELRKQMRDVNTLIVWLGEPSKSEELQLLGALMKLTKRQSIPIVSGAQHALRFQETWDHKHGFILVDAQGQERAATIADLGALGIADLATFDAALGEAFMTIQQSELP